MRKPQLLLRITEGLMDKVPFSIDKRKWSPSLIPGGIVLISTISPTGVRHFAPKSWIQMASFEPPMLVFSGSSGQTTEDNILGTQSFVINIVDESIVARVYQCIQWHGEERTSRSGFTFGSASK